MAPETLLLVDALFRIGSLGITALAAALDHPQFTPEFRARLKQEMDARTAQLEDRARGLI